MRAGAEITSGPELFCGAFGGVPVDNIEPSGEVSVNSTKLLTLILCLGLLSQALWSQAASDKVSASSGEAASSLPDNSKAPDLKAEASDEGKLATVKDAKIPSYSKIYVAPMAGFENYIIAGFRSKKVPLIVVVDKSKANYEISGVSESEKAGWAKMLFVGSQQSNETASIKVADLKTGAVIFGYSVHKTNSARGRQSAGEACAKHIKQIVLE
jgi:hypothetical protein